MAGDMVFVGMAAMGPVALGSLFCLRLWWLISSVKMDGLKDDNPDRALLSHRGNQIETMNQISKLIAKGANAFLMEEYRYLLPFIAISSVVVAVAIGLAASIAHVIGCATSILAGYVGMKIATYSNSRTTHECWRRGQAGVCDGYDVAMRGGWIASVSLVCLGLSGLYILSVIFYISLDGREEAWQALAGYSFGVASIGLFCRVGGGIFTKAADIGADLSGKLDYGLSEDDYRNPACIADNVGDNVGGVVGFGADLLSSLASANCAALSLAGSSGGPGRPGRCVGGVMLANGIGEDWRAMSLPILITSSSVSAGILSAATVARFFKVRVVEDIEKNLKMLTLFVMIYETPAVYFITRWCLPPTFAISCEFQELRPGHAAACIWIGIWSCVIIAYGTEHYTSYKRQPVREIAGAQRVSAASGVIFGLAVGYSSCALLVVCLAAATLSAQSIAGPYGVALAAVGMLTLLPPVLAIVAYDSIADNANGLAEMSGMDSDVRDITDVLGGGGAISNGFAIGAAALSSHALIHTFWRPVGAAHGAVAGAPGIMDRWYFAGLLIGAMLPYAFSAVTLKSVGQAAKNMVEECRDQFPRIIDSFGEPDYDRCIKISTKASLTQMGPAGAIVIGTPVVTGLLFGKVCATGLLQGSLVSGCQMAISMISTGGAWDNAKRLVAVETLNKEADEHYKNAVIGDLVGDPLKDVSGPSLNVLVNLSAVTSLLFGTIIGEWSGPLGEPFWAK